MDSILNFFEKLERLGDNHIKNEEKIFDIFVFSNAGRVTMLTIWDGCEVRVGDLDRKFVLEEHIIPLKQVDAISDTTSKASSKVSPVQSTKTVSNDSSWTKLSISHLTRIIDF